MPVYDYLCERCGPFTDTRPMAQCEDPNACPQCGDEAPRAFLTAPYFSTSNGRSANALQMQAHGSSCGCCTGPSMRRTKRG